MASKNKYGAFAGVFTPSILTILGVIMYLRMGWVVGNAGLIGTLMIIIIAHVISISTGLSVSSIATDKKVGAGGLYYILSRSMGIPMGGAIGITLYIGTAFSIALYLIGFAESFNGYFGLETGTNGLRISGTIALIVLTAIGLISTSVALKTQFFILAAIILSLGSIFLGSNEFKPETIQLFSGEGSAPLEVVFAIFFPAVTGFTAGIAMSGDLKDPKKSIPIGTLASIAVGLIVYIGLAFFIAFYINTDVLNKDNNILMKIAMYSPVVVAGIWGATLSSALGGVLGAPRILQAMSLDKITPGIFKKGKGKNNEPVNALILVFIIAQAGVLIGELDVIARVVSMFYLAAYGFINITFFLEGWANPDFQPTFKVKRWVGLVGFIASFGVMFKLDMIAMLVSLIVIGGIFLWLKRKQVKLDSGDVWQSVWENVVANGLKKLHAKETDTSNNWNPNIILFSGESEHRPYLLELANTVSGRTGIVTNFNLILNKDHDKPMARAEQIVKDSSFEELGIFARQVRVDNIFKGMEDIASTFGFSGVEPNTIMMGWPKLLDKSADYSKMTQKLLYLDYNLLYLDFDRKTKFGSYQTVDLWWRETDSKNAEMMLNIARFILQSAEWNKTKIRVLFVNNNNADNNLIKSKISKLVENLRVNVEIKIINNGVEQKAFYDLIELQSATTDLTLVGIPNYKIEKQAEFILRTNNLFETIGSTLLVKAADNFNVLDLDFSQEKTISDVKRRELMSLEPSNEVVVNDLVIELDKHLSETTALLSQPAFSSLSFNYYQFIDKAKNQFEETLKNLEMSGSEESTLSDIQLFLSNLIDSSIEFRKSKLPEIKDLLDKGIQNLLNERKEFIERSSQKIKYISVEHPNKGWISTKNTIYWRSILDYYYKSYLLPNAQKSFYDFGMQNFILLNQLTEGISGEIQLFVEKMSSGNNGKKESLTVFYSNIIELLDNLKQEGLHLNKRTIDSLNIYEREICIELMQEIGKPEFYKAIKKKKKTIKNKEINQYEANISDFASDWFRNQKLAHKQVESGAYLSIAGISVFEQNESIIENIRDSITTVHRRDLALLAEAAEYVNNHLDQAGLESYSNKVVDRLSDGIAHVDFDIILKNEEDKLLAISDTSPKLIELISSESFNDFYKCQNDEVEEIPVSLANIQGHIIQTSYISPLLENLNKLSKVFNENSEELYTSANQIKHIIGESIKKENRSLFKNNLNELQFLLNRCLINFNKLSDSINQDLNNNIQNTIADLNIRTIMGSIDSYSRISQPQVIKTNLQSWYEKKRKGLDKAYRDIINFVIQRKQDIDTIRFDEKHNQYLNNIEQTSHFLRYLTLKPKVERELSFYYKKLFTGSHLGSVNLKYRNKELVSARRAIERMDQGINGAILILGESLSGKTYMSETIANNYLKGEKFNINPPSKQGFTVNDVHMAFQDVFKKSGTAESILNQIEKKSILVFNDLEKWWVKSPNGAYAINYLSKMIEKFGNMHYFILNCNIHSFDIIRKTTELERYMLSTIIISPASKLELKEIIMSRHKIGGADLWYRNKPLNEAKRLDSFFNEINMNSNGNIGLALNSWITAMDIDKENRLSTRKPGLISFPNITNAQWKIVLYHFLIHGRLKEDQIDRIFEAQDQHWVLSTLKEMEKAGLVYRKSNHTYILNNSSRPYIEHWLKELKILK